MQNCTIENIMSIYQHRIFQKLRLVLLLLPYFFLKFSAVKLQKYDELKSMIFVSLQKF
jgi:hypothetical protein